MFCRLSLVFTMAMPPHSPPDQIVNRHICVTPFPHPLMSQGYPDSSPDQPRSQWFGKNNSTSSMYLTSFSSCWKSPFYCLQLHWSLPERSKGIFSCSFYVGEAYMSQWTMIHANLTSVRRKGPIAWLTPWFQLDDGALSWRRMKSKFRGEISEGDLWIINKHQHHEIV